MHIYIYKQTASPAHLFIYIYIYKQTACSQHPLSTSFLHLPPRGLEGFPVRVCQTRAKCNNFALFFPPSNRGKSQRFCTVVLLPRPWNFPRIFLVWVLVKSLSASTDYKRHYLTSVHTTFQFSPRGAVVTPLPVAARAGR